MQLNEVKEKQILRWMLPDNQVTRALNGDIIDIEQVLNHTMQLSPCLFDENVNWKVVQKYFIEGAWVMMRYLFNP